MNLLQNWKQKIKDSFYYFHQDRLQAKYYKLSGKWYDVSRQCYELKQHLYPECLNGSVCGKLCATCARYPIVKKYKKAYAKACELRRAVAKLEKERNKIR